MPSQPASRASAARRATRSSGDASIALLADVGGVQVGEHGDAEDLEAGAGAAGHRGAQGLGVVRVHGEEGGADRRRIARGALHRVLDVEQLHVEEDAFAGCRQLACEIEAAAHDELEADLVEGDGRPEPGHERARLLHRREVEGDDQAVARLNARQEEPPSSAVMGRAKR